MCLSGGRVSAIRARVALKVGKNSNIPAEIISFSKFDVGDEHVALVFKQADLTQDVPLVRVHSECLTGDVFHSSRCDCGEQLEETIQSMSEDGGIILYMRQEGRGIGLYNKLDAYVLQSQGVNTYDANLQLGFGEDLRSFDDAITMLNALDVNKIKLVTNNPKKIKELSSAIEVAEVINTSAFYKGDNDHYLASKISMGGHQLADNDEVK